MCAHLCTRFAGSEFEFHSLPDFSSIFISSSIFPNRIPYFPLPWPREPLCTTIYSSPPSARTHPSPPTSALPTSAAHETRKSSISSTNRNDPHTVVKSPAACFCHNERRNSSIAMKTNTRQASQQPGNGLQVSETRFANGLNAMK